MCHGNRDAAEWRCPLPRQGCRGRGSSSCARPNVLAACGEDSEQERGLRILPAAWKAAQCSSPWLRKSMVWACQAELIYIFLNFFWNFFTPASTFLSLRPLVRSLRDLQSAVVPLASLGFACFYCSSPATSFAVRSRRRSRLPMEHQGSWMLSETNPISSELLAESVIITNAKYGALPFSFGSLKEHFSVI